MLSRRVARPVQNRRVKDTSRTYASCRHYVGYRHHYNGASCVLSTTTYILFTRAGAWVLFLVEERAPHLAGLTLTPSVVARLSLDPSLRGALQDILRHAICLGRGTLDLSGRVFA